MVKESNMGVYNLARMTSTTTGTGTLTLGSAVSGSLSFADAGVPDGAVVSYGISDGANTEVGRGTYTSAGTTLSRDTVLASTNSGNKINCSGNEQVSIVVVNKDLTRYVSVQVIAPGVNCSTGDDKIRIVIPPELAGANLTSVHAYNTTAGTTGTMDIQVHNLTDAQDMLSTVITIDSTENGSDTAATPAVIDTSHDDVAAYDVLRIDVDAIHTTPAKGLLVTLGFSF